MKEELDNIEHAIEVERKMRMEEEEWGLDYVALAVHDMKEELELLKKRMESLGCLKTKKNSSCESDPA